MTNRHLRFLIPLLFVLFLISRATVCGQDISIKKVYFAQFDVLNKKDGLANTHILNIQKDASNAMWFASFDFVSRFNGQTIENFRFSSDDQSIKLGIVYDLDLVDYNNLWIASESGLFLYNRELDQFNMLS